jgi:N-hydroxyarylamine O-acetyltransferase
MKSDFGNHVLEMKLKVKDTDWRKGYAFDSSRPLGHLSELNEVQSIIVGHEHSPFNKAPLITRLTGDGNITLTDTSFTRWRNGEVKKEQINNSKFGELARL